MNVSSKDLKYFFSGSAFLGVSSLYGLVIPVIIIPYLIKVIGLGNYGLSVVAFSTTFFLSLIIDYGYAISGVNSLSKSRTDSEKSAIIIKALYTKAILFFSISLLFLLLMTLIPYLRVHATLFLLSLLIPFSSILNLNWALQGLQLIKGLSFVTILNKTIYLFGIFFMIKNPEDYIYINFIFGAGILISGFISLFLIKRKVNLRWVGFSFNELLIEIEGSAHYFVSNISVYISTSLYPIILSLFATNEIVGVFAAVEKIYNVMRAPFSIYINLMLPRISEMIEKSKHQAVRLIKKTYFFVVLFMLIALFLVWNFQQPIIAYFVEDYMVLSTRLLHLALLGLVIVIFNCPVYLLLLAMDEKKAIMRTFLSIPLIGMLTCLLAAKFYGAEGVFYTVLFVELLYVISLQWLYYRIAKNTK
ncbi:oligosaccharide flippase family protein [uncultured Aquimarina sp.]|uniref:oligosaccharide flippase family protein n=1 Tax=uncultured Aquimarina sp. TaxID=575652 RepID=UPI00260E9A4E|nr:oligosaccharide flippase family protein [uncultured Aquimarina sp.]